MKSEAKLGCAAAKTAWLVLQLVLTWGAERELEKERDDTASIQFTPRKSQCINDSQ